VAFSDNIHSPWQSSGISAAVLRGQYSVPLLDPESGGPRLPTPCPLPQRQQRAASTKRECARRGQISGNGIAHCTRSNGIFSQPFHVTVQSPELRGFVCGGSRADFCKMRQVRGEGGGGKGGAGTAGEEGYGLAKGWCG